MTFDLPANWRMAALGEVLARIEAGASFRCEERPPEDGETGVAKVSAVTWGTYNEEESKTVLDAGRINERLLVRPGDFLFSRANTINLVGACVIARQVNRRVMLSDKILRFHVRGALPEFVLYFLRSSGGRAEIERLSTGNQESMRNIGQDRIRAIRLPLAPLPEQRRIVAALEEHLSALDAAVAGLVRARANVTRYRAAVLDEAVHAGTDALPAGWQWTSLGEISDVQGGIQKQPKRAPVSNHYPFLRVANVHRGRLVLDEVHRIELFGAELSRLRLERGDLLIVEGNGSQSEIGRMAVWDGSIENCVHQNHIIRARPREGVSSEYLAFYWNSPSGARRVQAVASSTSGLHTLSVAKVKGIPVPLPPFEEQQRIVESVGVRLAVADRTLDDIDVQRARAARLRQSILQSAFSGGLVPQDPADAPAFIAPEPDHSERSSAPASSRPARGRGRTARTGSRRG